jgi:hypothetical protein
MMSPMPKKRLSQMSAGAAVIILSCSALLAHDLNPASMQKATSPIQTDSSQLPDGPIPVKVPSQKPSPDPAQRQPQSAEPSDSATSAPKAQVTVLEDTLIRVRTNQPVTSRYSKDGTPVLFTLSEDVVIDNVLIVPRGATIHGEVVQTRKAGVLTGSPELTLKLVSLDLGGRSYPLYTYQFKVQGTSKTKPTETKVKGGALVGAIVGGVFSGSAKGGTTDVGRVAGMATGAAVGAGMGTVVAAATPGPALTIPAEAQMDFYLASPISVAPLSANEATRLAQKLHPGDPVLYVRGDTPQK